MFSRRTPVQFAPNALTLRAAERRARGLRILDLTESNPTRAGFEAPRDLLASLGRTGAGLYVPEARGSRTAREAVSRDYASRGAGVDPDRVLLTASSSESYSLLLKLLCDPGDEILVPVPSYPLFGYLAELEGVRTVSYPLQFDHEWHLSLDALSALIGPRTRAVIVVQPNNPTGSFLSAAEARGLAGRCGERGLALIADEVFADFTFPRSHPGPEGTFAVEEAALCFTLGGLSKSCALPQLKLGWIAVSGPRDLREEASNRLEFIADTYLSVSTPVQLALPAILRAKPSLQAPIKERLAGNLETLRAAVASRAELSILPVAGGWSAIVQCPASRSDEERALLALDAGVLVHPGHFFDFEAGCYLIASLLGPPGILEEALPGLLDAAVR